MMRSEAEVRDAKAVIDWMYEGATTGTATEGQIAAMGGILKWVLGDDRGYVARVLARAKVEIATGGDVQ